MSPAVTSQVGSVVLVATLCHLQGSRGVGGWSAQGCLRILYAEVLSLQGVFPLSMCAHRA